MVSDSLLGAVVDGRYVIARRIARGGMATVYRARDKRLERDVAIKLMHRHLAESPDFTARFNREARAAARLSSAYVVTVHDQGVWDSGDGRHAYLVMEYVPGPDVRSELIRTGSFTLGTALAITEQTLRALSSAHSAGIVHRDVKPENVMLTSRIPPVSIFERPEIHAKVADFGLARAVTSVSPTTGQAMGTVTYMAPEVITTGVAEAPADVYAVGIMLYEFLTGELPFQAETPIATAYMHINEPMPHVAEQADWIPASLDSFIALLTAKDASQRPANGEEALRELLAITRSIPEEDLIRRIPVIPAPQSDGEDDDGEDDAPPDPKPLPAAPTTTMPMPGPVPPDGAAPAAEPIPPGGGADDGNGARRLRRRRTDLRHETPELPGRRRRQGRRAWAALAILLAVALTAVLWYFRAGPGKRVTIPAVAGQTYEQALSSLREEGLTARRRNVYSDTVPSGSVVSTDPGGGGRVHPSRVVTVTVSRGVEQVTVPDLSGLSAQEARRRLGSARLVYREAAVYSESVDEGRVVSQSVAADTAVNHDSAVTVTISKGRQPIRVPNVVGKSEADANNAIRKAGLTVSRQEEHSDTVAQGVVISQDPSKGTVHRGDSVTVVVSQGPELVDVPNVVDMRREEATTTLQNAGFQVQADNVFGGYFGIVRSQSPAAGTKARKGTGVKIAVF
ncbi:PASTA domain protein [Actinobaculum sp. oral taxon 183 str. F0552]|uniref:Stk1 family PASTA domain-containing Ser/Thr kinase n=1 Tax=Actinobaculum sp. oral taxon 183 TaxID=712888 RepID=UPI000397C5F7|nr:Stk1 family PASTA domain-containing Ser/Thr kinase [Actinobaculum sp. oral taxon 183]ERH16648.1 PASTA domain protein [Actinobaculum sp. oral taxon 183 str. F0552]RKV69110.1 MAG: Stk1 family PASTA domain-containing Ser/Thr kinase [Actinomyces sp.]